MHVTAVTALVRASAGYSSGRFAVFIEDGIPMPANAKPRKPSSTKTTRPSHTEERIRLKAYEIYERRGRVDGFALDDWLQAEAEVVGTAKKPKARVAKRSK